MMKHWIGLGCLLVFLSGCTSTPSQRGAVGGGLLGAAIGQIAGRDTEATLIGAGVGALTGAIVYDHIDQSKRSAYHQGYDAGYKTPPPPPTRVYPSRYTRVYHHREYIVAPPPPPPTHIYVYP